jgi:hypothetical protein
MVWPSSTVKEKRPLRITRLPVRGNGRRGEQEDAAGRSRDSGAGAWCICGYKSDYSELECRAEAKANMPLFFPILTIFGIKVRKISLTLVL